MAKTWVLDTDTKGTGAHVVPLEKALAQPEAKKDPPKRAKPARLNSPAPRRRPGPTRKTAGALAPGHVRKKTTGEIGKVQSVDPKAGTATVLWLRQGRASTVPLSAITRK